MHPAIPPTLRPLALPSPPMLAEALGYRGAARFVAFHWSPFGDEAMYDDGYASGTGEWTGYLAFVSHPAVRPLLGDARLGDSEREAEDWLLADLVEGRLYLGHRSVVDRFLRAANASTSPPLAIAGGTAAEGLEHVLDGVRTGAFIEQLEEVALDQEAVCAHVAAQMGRQDRVVASLVAWLHGHLGCGEGP
jgi:hypothetical protein